MQKLAVPAAFAVTPAHAGQPVTHVFASEDDGQIHAAKPDACGNLGQPHTDDHSTRTHRAAP